MTDNLNTVITKLKREEDYHSERLKLLFGICFRKPQQAYEKYQRFEKKRGYDRASLKMKDRARKFGAIKGRLIMGFWKNETRRNAELSLKELQYHARKLHLTRLQLKEAENKQNQEKQKQQQQKHGQEMQKTRENKTENQQSSQMRKQ